MAVCVDCKLQYSQLREDIHRLKSELRKKDQLIESFVSVAAAQAQHISYIRSSSLAVPAARSPSSLVSPMVSASAATLPWLASMNASTAPVRPERPAAEVNGHSSVRKLDAGAPGTTPTAAALDRDVTTLTPPVDPEVGSGTRLMAPVHSSTPMPSQQSWTEVLHCGRMGDPVEGGISPPVTLSNRFTLLMDDNPVHPCDASAIPATMAPPVTAESPPPVASTDRAARHSTSRNNRRRMLQEAVIRRSRGLPRAEPPRPCPPAQTLQPEPPSSMQTEVAERPLSCPGSSRSSSSPRPLFPPTTLIIGDSITRDIRFINAITHCFPGATVPVILDKILDLLRSLPTSIKRIVLHVGTNDTSCRESEHTKNNFNLLFNVLKDCGKSVYISGPIPSLGRGADRFSRILSLHTWLQSACRSHNMDFIDNFNLFWDRASLFKRDGIHPNKRGSQMLLANIQHAVQTSPPA